MLVETFGLRRDPFLDTADPSFYYETISSAHARRRLYETLAQGRGLAVVIGPIGAGKTTLANAVQQQLLEDDRNLVGLILDPTFETEAELLATLASTFGFPVERGLSARELRDELKRHLFAVTTGSGRQPILFIDEAQLLKPELLESLRTLLNYQLDERKTIAIALFGQMELGQMIAARPNFNDRVALWIDVPSLTLGEASALLDHRLARAGFSGDASPFEGAALDAMWRQSRGLPRRLTAIARESMETAAERGVRTVGMSEVAAALRRMPPMPAVEKPPIEVAKFEPVAPRVDPSLAAVLADRESPNGEAPAAEPYVVVPESAAPRTGFWRWLTSLVGRR